MNLWSDHERAEVRTTHSSGRRFCVRSVYTLAGEWGTGSHSLGLPSIDVSRQSTGLGKTMRLKASKGVQTTPLGERCGKLALGWPASPWSAVQTGETVRGLGCVTNTGEAKNYKHKQICMYAYGKLCADSHSRFETKSSPRASPP